MRTIKGPRLCVVLVLGAGLAACASSPPMRFYTLMPVGTENAGGNAPPAIRVARVSLPGEIDRPQLVQRTDATRLRLAEDDRWAAPLGEMIQRALSADLQSRVPATATEPDQLVVEIEEFMADANCAVTLRAAWNLKVAAGASTQPIRGYETVRAEPSGTCQVSGLPQVMSRALAELANRVAAARAK